jgi:hypothetical protein
VSKLRGSILNETKSTFLVNFGISGRHFNSIRVALQGKIDSYRSNLCRYINETYQRIEAAKKTIEKLTKKEVEPEKRQKHLLNIHHKKRRLARQEIGRIKYASRYGLTVHHAAALVIARRLCRFSERTSSCCRNKVLIPNNKGGHVTFSLPARNRGKLG